MLVAQATASQLRTRMGLSENAREFQYMNSFPY